MQVYRANNTLWEQHKPVKRDYQFKVIEVHVPPKYYIWPSRKGSVDRDENYNTQDSLRVSGPSTSSTATTATSAYSSAPASANHNGYGAARRSLARRRNQEAAEPSSRSVPPRCAACHCRIEEPSSAVPVRKLSQKKDKANTEPLSASMPTFQILSIEKKWESFDAEETDEDELDEGLAGMQIEEGRRWTHH
ncbi:unnamed protein product, partial [Mesorhabditis spiculigera]